MLENMGCAGSVCEKVALIWRESAMNKVLKGRNVYNPRRKPGETAHDNHPAPTGRDFSACPVTPRWG